MAFDAIAEVAKGRLNDFKPQELANTGCAFATASHASLLLLGAMVKAEQSRLKDFNSQELANIVWAFAKVGHASLVLLI